MTELSLPLAGALATVVAMPAGWLSLRADRLAEDPKVEHRRWRLRGPGTGAILVLATLAGAFGVGWPVARQSPDTGLKPRG